MSLENIAQSIMGYYLRKLTMPTNQHYGYVSSILVSAFIEHKYMLLGGSNLFRLASELFKIVKLNYWSKLMDNYTTILEKKENTLESVLCSPLLDRYAGKKIDVQIQMRLPSRKVMTTRRPEWRCVAKICGKWGHWIQHHTHECVNDKICRKIDGTVFCVKSYIQMLMQHKIQLTMEMYNRTLNLIIRTFREDLGLLQLPEEKGDFMKMRCRVDLAPRLYNAIVRKKKGTSMLINYLNKGKYKPAEKIQSNWKMEERAKAAELTGTAWYKRCLDRNRFKTF